ncbi:hypothetical protein ABEV37_06205 [Chromobacterium piscinae]
MPEHVQPSRRLRAAAKHAMLGKQAWKTKRMKHRHQGGIQVTDGQESQARMAQNGKLSEQQRGCHQVIDRQRRLVDGNKSP